MSKKIAFIFIGFLFVISECYSEASEGRIVHFSIDDVNRVLFEITKNEEKYESVFDHDFFRLLKDWHDEYDIKVTLYAFCESNNFSLDECTDKFANEFNSNSSWLKFGYHGFAPSVVFENKSYEYFIKEIKRITGSENSISTTVRLDYFEWTERDILLNSFLNAEYGITALLCADNETRKSYYLTQEQQTELNDKEIVLDKSGIYFFTTDFRFDDFKNFDFVFTKNRDEHEIIVFTHEWLLNVPLRKNIFLYLANIYRRSQVIKNIENFFSWCSSQNYKYVTDFGV